MNMGQDLQLDAEGYLADLNDWSPVVAEQLAASLPLELSEPHWELIWLIRDYYQKFDHSPAMRPFIKFIRLNLDADKAKSIYLMQLFPGEGSPVKRIALLGGLPKPDNCL